MVLRLIVFFIFIGYFDTAMGQDNIGSGHAISFDGIDDYIDLGDIYDDLTLPITISAWVNVDPVSNYAFPIFNSQDNLPIYNGITFLANPTSFSIQYGDGRGENDPSFRRGKGAYVSDISGRWVHMAAVMRDANDMDLFLNGVNVGGFYAGDSDQPMSSLSPGDVAKIGYWHSNGGTFLFKGQMDEIRLWNRALSENEIRETMCKKLTGNETGLIGYWTFDETTGDVLTDKSSNHFSGQLKGNPTRVFSGAPIGDESILLYTSNWSGTELSMQDGLDKVTALNVMGDPQGLHIYEVKELPSQTNGLDLSLVKKPYFGIFAASDGLNKSFDVNYTIDGNGTCSFFTRSDNSVPSWNKTNLALTNVSERIELIKVPDEGEFQVSIGPDTILCDWSQYALTTGVDPIGKSFLWSTGETSSTISVNQSGLYSVKVSEGCKVDSDSAVTTFLRTPPVFSLGEDEITCKLKPRLLSPVSNPSGFNFAWQDGSSQPTFQVFDFGVYWVSVWNICGTKSDTLRILKIETDSIKIPNVFTPNGDMLNQFFEIDQKILGSSLNVYNRWGEQVYQSVQYQNNWDATDLPSGIYFYRLVGDCITEKKGPVTILK